MCTIENTIQRIIQFPLKYKVGDPIGKWWW